MKHHLYYETLGRDVYLKNFFRNNKKLFLKALQEDFKTKEVFLTRSGRTGIILSLKAFGLTRQDEVLVPRFMSTCVLDAVNQVAAPSLHLTQHTKAVLFYHHWGYQQNYEKAKPILDSRKLWIIEDCAHGVWGKSQGKVMGTFGHTAIFSLSKIFELTYSGALRINDNSLSQRIEELLPSKQSFRCVLESLRGEWEYLSFYNIPIDRRSDIDVQTGLVKWYATLLTYPGLSTIRGNLSRSKEEVREVFTKQNKHFLTLLNNARHRSFMLPGDQEEAMAPLCFPVISDDAELLNQINEWLKQRDIFIGTYHFDINRCMFDPNYKKCVPVPLYASLPEELFTDFVRDFKGRF